MNDVRGRRKRSTQAAIRTSTCGRICCTFCEEDTGQYPSVRDELRARMLYLSLTGARGRLLENQRGKSSQGC